MARENRQMFTHEPAINLATRTAWPKRTRPKWGRPVRPRDFGLQLDNFRIEIDRC
jgi:hypothetical protein